DDVERGRMDGHRQLRQRRQRRDDLLHGDVDMRVKASALFAMSMLAACSQGVGAGAATASATLGTFGQTSSLTTLADTGDAERHGTDSADSDGGTGNMSASSGADSTDPSATDEGSSGAPDPMCG